MEPARAPAHVPNRRANGMEHDESRAAGHGPSRRHLLGSVAAVPAVLALRPRSGQKRAGSEQEAPARAAEPSDALEAFYGRWIPRARALVAEERPNEDAFLLELCAELVRHEPAFFPRRRQTVFSGAGMRTGPVGRDDVFQLIEVELEPGAAVLAHNHVGYAFVTLCLEGEARVRHFEPEPGSPSALEFRKDFQVREVENALLRPGRFSTLTRTRANVHALTAGREGARLLDFGIKFPTRGDGPVAFSALEVDPEPSDAARGAYSARWIGNVHSADDAKAK